MSSDYVSQLQGTDTNECFEISKAFFFFFRFNKERVLRARWVRFKIKTTTTI